MGTQADGIGAAKATRASGRKQLAVAVGVVILLGFATAGCGSKSSTSTGATAAPETTTTAAPVLTAAQLQAAALAVSDLPPGWATDTTLTTGSGSATSGAGSSSGTASLCTAGSDLTKKETHDKAEAGFQKTTTGPFVLQTVGTAPDAAAHYTDMKTSLSSCVGQTWTEISGGETVSYTFQEMSAAQVGDQSVAYRLNGSAPSGYMVTMDFVLTQRGSVVTLYTGVSLAGLPGTTPLDPTEFSTIIKTGDDKVANALTGQQTP
jgi:hypothetical protein